MIRRDSLLAWPMVVFMALFFLAPLVVLGGISLRQGAGGWGLGNFSAFLSDPFAAGVLMRTLGLGAQVTFWVSLLSLPLVMLYWHGGRHLRSAILICALLPMLTSNVVRTFAWVVILGRNGPISQSLLALGLSDKPVSFMFSQTGLVMALVQIELPLLILPVISVLSRADGRVLEAAEVLGAGRWRAWFSAIFPQIVPAVLAGWVLVFASATTSYVTQSVIGGARLIFLPAFVYREVGILFQWPMAAAISILLLASTGVIMLGLTLLARHERLQAHG